MQHCSLQHRTLLPLCHIHNWVLFLLWLHPFILLELFLHWSPVAYWAPTDLGSSSFSVPSLCLFILFSRQERWSVLPFTPPVIYVSHLPVEPPSPPPSHPLGHRSARLGSLCYTATLTSAHGSVYMLMLLSPFVPLSPSPTVSTSPSLHLHCHSFPANTFTSTIFLDSVYMC